MAFWKMLGLLVTPTTCRSRIRSARLPARSGSRLMSSSQTETAALLSWASGSDMIAPRSASVAGGRTLDGGGAREARVRGGDDPVGGQAELFVDDLGRRGCAEALDADPLAELADELPPSLCDCGFDGHPGPDRRGEYGLTVGRV